MRTWLDIHPTGRKHCSACKRWRHGVDFTVRKWTDYSCTVPANLSSACNMCVALKRREKWGYKPREWYPHGLPGSAENKEHRRQTNMASRHKRRKRKAQREMEAEYRRIWRNAKMAEAKREEESVMAKRKSEDVMIAAHCVNEACDSHEFEVYINGRYNAEGEFEAYDEIDVLCDECDNLLVMDEP